MIVDETSNLELPKKSGALDPLLKFLLNLINSSGVPFLFTGNEEMLEVFSKTTRVARRVENGGFISMGPMLDDMWNIYVKRLWKMQVTYPVTVLNNELSEHLKNITAAVPDLATRTFIETQKVLIGSGDERITISALNHGKRVALVLTADKLRDYDEDLPKNNAIQSGPLGKKGKSKPVKNNIIFDPNRPQHPEFEKVTYNLMGQINISMKNISSTLIQDAGLESNIMEFLEKQDVILSAPLNLVS